MFHIKAAPGWGQPFFIHSNGNKRGLRYMRKIVTFAL
jgi:hypothetical protein